MDQTRPLAAACLVLAALGCSATPNPPVRSPAELDQRVLVNVDGEGLALMGHDPVAYFTDGKPTPGDPRWRSRFCGATYQFASADHKALFDAEPSKYEPQFGGYCGYAASIDKVSPISVDYWEILDGRLVLQHNEKAWKLWHGDVAGNLVRADRNWPGLVAKHGEPEKLLVNVDEQGLALQGGHDPVAFFTDGRPLLGSSAYESTYRGARYRFATADHQRAFDADPAQYEPQFGGYCGYAASIQKVSPIDVQFWQIENGRLILQHTQQAFDLFNSATRENLANADRNWPGLVQQHGL